ncbi:MAG TPA: hypothetical protein DET40_24830 [Lentisphaeria bacterium]|nr:MAG: hypothetical protein A2X45_01175 [Lentisphaerae bacterium GWF2_50_93]HCE46786.1 hypothetical protein [Lentisphaeria bacterium]
MAIRKKPAEQNGMTEGAPKTGMDPQIEKQNQPKKEVEHYSKVKFGALTYDHAKQWRGENPVDDKNISSVTTNALMSEVTKGDIREMRRRQNYLKGVKQVMPDGKLDDVKVSIPFVKITKDDVAEYRRTHPRHVEWLNRLNRAAVENVVTMRRMKSSLRLNGKFMQGIIAKVEKENHALIEKIREKNANVIEPFRSIRTNKEIQAAVSGNMPVADVDASIRF